MKKIILAMTILGLAVSQVPSAKAGGFVVARGYCAAPVRAYYPARPVVVCPPLLPAVCLPPVVVAPPVRIGFGLPVFHGFFGRPCAPVHVFHRGRW